MKNSRSYNFNQSIKIILLSTLPFGLGYILIVGFNYIYQPLYSFEQLENNHGTYTELYPGGHIKSIENYLKGKRHGNSIFLNPQGDTLKITNYFNGKKHGYFNYYTTSGKVVINELYDRDSLVFKKIVNDSLYYYDYMARETGMMAYERACYDCHQSVNEMIGFQDSLLFLPKLDTIHLCIIDTISVGNVQKQYLELNKNELEAIKFYIQDKKIENSQKTQPTRFFRNEKKRIAS